MDVVESQQRLVDAIMFDAIGIWRSQLRVHMEECYSLKSDLETKTEELQQLQHSMINVEAVRQENEQLKEELNILRRQYESSDSSYHYRELENERDAMLQDNLLKQKTIGALQDMVKYEKLKSRDWSRHSNSSPSPAFLGCGSGPRQSTKAGEKLSTATLAHEELTLSNGARLQKLVSPPEKAEAPPKSQGNLTQGRSAKRTRIISVEDSMCDRAPEIVLATDGTERRKASMSFPDLDGTYSHGNSSEELLSVTGLQPHSSPVEHRPANSRSIYECYRQSAIEPFPSGSTTPLLQPRPQHESDEGQLYHEETCSDPLEVVSAHRAKRAAQNSRLSVDDAKIASLHIGNAEEPIRVKSEAIESFHTAAANRSGMIHTVERSPRKRPSEVPGQDRSSYCLAAPGKMPILRIAVDETGGPAKNYCDVQPVQPLSARKDNVKSRGPPRVAQSTLLQEINNDEQIRSRTSDRSWQPTKKRKSNERQEAAAIPILTEDGEDHNRSRKTPVAKLPALASPAQSNTSVFRRLGNLLEGPSPAKPVLAKPSPQTSNLMNEHLLDAAASARSGTKDQLDATRTSENKTWEWYESAESLLDSISSQRPPQPKSKITKTSLESHEVTEKPRRDQRRFLAPKRKLLGGPEDEEPFHSRPVHRLDLDHFKVNPKSNAGVDYAHKNVVRYRDHGNCLHGCTRPRCCGSQFRAIGGTLTKVSTSGRQFLEADSSGDANSQQSDHSLLVNFLGPGNEEKIRTLTSMARENLLLEARTKITADKYGKTHRQAHERPKSPPGFWRTEMPGTQEDDVDRLDGKK